MPDFDNQARRFTVETGCTLRSRAVPHLSIRFTGIRLPGCQ